MKISKILQSLTALVILAVSITGCQETIWPDVEPVGKAEFLGSWTAQNFRLKTTYIRTQDPVTKDFMVRDTTVTDSITMKFEFGLNRASGLMVEDSVRITTTLTKNGIPQTPVVRSGYYSPAETAGNDYRSKALYINVWERTATVHTGFANPVAEPFTTYSVIKKSATEMELLWTLYNNTSQSSITYKVLLKK